MIFFLKLIHDLKAKLASHPARCLSPVEIVERYGLTTGPATVELLCHRLNCDDCRDGVMGTVLMCIFNVN